MEIRGLDDVLKQFEAAPKEIRAAGAKVLEEIGGELLSAVRHRIGGTGRVAGAQESRIGSGKGYVAVRAKANTDLDGYAAGYVTNALEGGHKQTPGRYIPAIGRELKRDRVPGKYMYAHTRDQEMQAAANTAAARIQAELEDLFG